MKIIGYAAAFLTTIAFLPQVLKVHRTRSTADISLAMFIVFSSGILLWLIYGYQIGDLPILVANAVTFALCLYILLSKLRFG